MASIDIYPLKGGGAISLKEARVTARGLEHDHRLMVIDPDTNNFITQREEPRLALIQPQVTDEGEVVLNGLNYGGTVLRADTIEGEPFEVTMHKGEKVLVQDHGNIAASWISNFLGRDLRLVKQTDRCLRRVDTKYGTKNDLVSLADGMPFLVTNEASLKDLSQYFETEAEIGMDRFRPNIVLKGEGLGPWQEDRVWMMKIGHAVFEFVKPCTRCNVTTVNQLTGIMADNPQAAEPLSTLREYRRAIGEGIVDFVFGQNAVPRQMNQWIAVGDKVVITDQQDPHASLASARLQARPFNPF